MKKYSLLIFSILAAASLAVSCASNSGSKASESDGQILFYGDDIAVAQTKYGKVRGFILRDIYTFKGIPY